MIRGKIAIANKSIIWIREAVAENYESAKGKSTCLPYYKYGNEYFPIPIEKLDVFFTCYNPEKTPNWERGELRNNQTELWG